MWVDEQVEATVEFPRSLAFPCLRAIRYRDRCVRFASPLRSESTSTALLYRGHAEGGEYSVRYEVASQRWILEAVRDIPDASCDGRPGKLCAFGPVTAAATGLASWQTDRRLV